MGHIDTIRKRFERYRDGDWVAIESSERVVGEDDDGPTQVEFCATVEREDVYEKRVRSYPEDDR